MKLPKYCYLGKKQTNIIMCGGNYTGSESAQIYLVCADGSEGCHDSIAILCNSKYNRNSILDAISDDTVNNIFRANGWNIEKNICPNCAEKQDYYKANTISTNSGVGIQTAK